ncbi:MAG: M48 family metallopeptidase [Nitrososphaeraceae archaeon]
MLIKYTVDNDIKNTIYIKQLFSFRAKSISLKASTSGIFIIIPKHIHTFNIMNFLNSKKKWIIRVYNYYKKYNHNYAKSYEDHKYVKYLGNNYLVNIVKDVNFSFTISQTMNKITFHIPNKRLYKKFIKSWYKNQTSIIISKRIDLYKKKLDVEYNNVRFKDNSSLWGSCSVNKNLNFNIYLSAFPLDVIDYVLIHELSHLKALDHSKNFWNIVNSLDPNYKKHKIYLQNPFNMVTI